MTMMCEHSVFSDFKTLTWEVQALIHLEQQKKKKNGIQMTDFR